MAYTGKVTIVDQDGNGWDAWSNAGVVQVPQDADFMVVPTPIDGCVWTQTELDTKEGE